MNNTAASEPLGASLPDLIEKLLQQQGRGSPISCAPPTAIGLPRSVFRRACYATALAPC